MTYLVGQALKDVGRRVALGLIFTKADLVDDPEKETIDVDDELYKTLKGRSKQSTKIRRSSEL